jgi:hypothetical protein
MCDLCLFSLSPYLSPLLSYTLEACFYFGETPTTKDVALYKHVNVSLLQFIDNLLIDIINVKLSY